MHTHAGELLALGREFARERRFAQAEACYRDALDALPDHPPAHAGLGWCRQMQGDHDGAVAHYRRALELDPDLISARRNLAVLLVQLGQREQSLPLWHAELRDGGGWANELLTVAMRSRDLTLAGDYADILASPRRGEWHPSGDDRAQPGAMVTVPRLRHDIEQFRYLQDRGILGAEFTSIIRDYQSVIERLTSEKRRSLVRLEGETRQRIGHVYNRIVHVRPTPRLRRALSGTWDAAAVERDYLDNPPGVVVVDDFLSRETLEELRLFCLESTIWSANRPLGRLGSLFRDGFNCPLLLQIAEELRDTLPRVIGERHPLRHMWGFKSGPVLAADSTTHADFAAVNVNFWITPDEANLDPAGGGLVVYGVDAPAHWDFRTYNGRLEDVIKPFLRRQQARAVTIPYRQNRAVIFNSDLFHATAGLRFRPGYENRRTNVTMLYGDRENDTHHRGLARPEPAGEASGRTNAWRSAAFSLARWRS